MDHDLEDSVVQNSLNDDGGDPLGLGATVEFVSLRLSQGALFD